MDLVLSTMHSVDACAVVAVQGDLDLFSAPAFRSHFEDLVGTGQHHLVIDLDGVEFLDSTGIGALVAVLRLARGRDGSVRLVCTNARIVWLLGITGVARDLPTYESHAAAGAAATGSG